MPFPPAFDHVWDLTQPPDTQLANQGALDFRNLKDDIMQRMSLLSGTTANRPTPETVNAVWGGAGFGLIFFATDTGFLWQWNGAAWVPLVNSFAGVRVLGKTSAPVANTGNTTENTLLTVIIPAQRMSTFGILRTVLSFSGNLFNSGSGALAKVRLNGQVLGGFTLISGTYNYTAESYIANVNATNVQTSYGSYIGNNPIEGASHAGIFAVSAGTVDTTIDQNLTITLQNVNAGDTFTLNHAYVVCETP